MVGSLRDVCLRNLDYARCVAAPARRADVTCNCPESLRRLGTFAEARAIFHRTIQIMRTSQQNVGLSAASSFAGIVISRSRRGTTRLPHKNPPPRYGVRLGDFGGRWLDERAPLSFHCKGYHSSVLTHDGSYPSDVGPVHAWWRMHSCVNW